MIDDLVMVLCVMYVTKRHGLLHYKTSDGVLGV